jgi:hypothetical protein
MDYVFIPSENKIYIMRTSISFEVFLIIAMLTIHISIVLAHNMEILMGSCTLMHIDAIWSTHRPLIDAIWFLPLIDS